MEPTAFWDFVDRVHFAAPCNMDAKCELLRRALTQLSDADLRDFLGHFEEANARAYDWKLWAAAYVLNGGCSDDSFSDFRASLISRGKTAFETALADPDSLADSESGEELFYEGYQYVAQEVATSRWGGLPARLTPFPTSPSGRDWKEEDLPHLLPRLAGDADLLAPINISPLAPPSQPTSLAEWRKIPLPLGRILDLYVFAKIWTFPDAERKFAEMRRGMDRAAWGDPALKSALKQIQRHLDETLEGHERLIDDALRARGHITFTEFQAHQGKTLEKIINGKPVTKFVQLDLVKRVLESDLPLSLAERATLKASAASYDPDQDPTRLNFDEPDQ